MITGRPAFAAGFSGGAEDCRRVVSTSTVLLLLVLVGRCSVAGDSKPASSQCLHHPDTWLRLRNSVCSQASADKRLKMVRDFYLPHCYHYKLGHVLNETAIESIMLSSDQCNLHLDHVLGLDKMTAHFVCEFEDILQRYDCTQSFSIKSSCHKCKEAYRSWMCSMTLPWWMGSRRIRPCRTFCHEVERLCPYFLPAEKTGPGSQYAGEPSFLCIDPDVRQTSGQAANSSYGDEQNCYRPCTLNYNLEPEVFPAQCSIDFIEQSDPVFDNSTATAKTTITTQPPNAADEVWTDHVVDQTLHQDGGQLSSSASLARTSYLQFGWRWRTLVLLLFLLECVTRLLT